MPYLTHEGIITITRAGGWLHTRHGYCGGASAAVVALADGGPVAANAPRPVVGLGYLGIV